MKPSFSLPPVRPFSLSFRSFASASSPSSEGRSLNSLLKKSWGQTLSAFACPSPRPGRVFLQLSVLQSGFLCFCHVLRDIFYEDTGNIFSSLSGTYCLCYSAGFQCNSCFPVRSLLYAPLPPVLLSHGDNLGTDNLLPIFLPAISRDVCSFRLVPFLHPANFQPLTLQFCLLTLSHSPPVTQTQL